MNIVGQTCLNGWTWPHDLPGHGHDPLAPFGTSSMTRMYLN
jgi:hypothetical protein